MKDDRIMTANGSIVGTVKVSSNAQDHPNFDNTKLHRYWPDWEEDVAELCDQIKNKDWLFVYGIPRGGVTLATQISHRLGIPMVADAPGYWMLNWYHWRMRQNIELESKSKNILIVDSICDTGSTLDHIKKQLYSIANGDEMNYTFAVVDVDPGVIQKVDNYVNVKGPEWLVYPWEFGSQELKKL